MQVKERTTVRRVFPTWTIDIPAGFSAAFRSDGSWEGWDDDRLISLTGMLITDRRTGSPAPADALLAGVPLEGDPIAELPPGVVGRAAAGGEALQGVVAVPGRLLLATIRGGDPAWRLETWRSIRSVPERRHPTFSRAGRRPW